LDMDVRGSCPLAPLNPALIAKRTSVEPNLRYTNRNTCEESHRITVWTFTYVTSPWELLNKGPEFTVE
jgi:hypothetical protein